MINQLHGFAAVVTFINAFDQVKILEAILVDFVELTFDRYPVFVSNEPWIGAEIEEQVNGLSFCGPQKFLLRYRMMAAKALFKRAIDKDALHHKLAIRS